MMDPLKSAKLKAACWVAQNEAQPWPLFLDICAKGREIKMPEMIILHRQVTQKSDLYDCRHL